MALKNIKFLVVDNELACEDVLIGLPVLQHRGIDSRTLLERNRAVFDGTDWSSVKKISTDNPSGVLGRLARAREKRQAEGCHDVPHPKRVLTLVDHVRIN